MTFHPIATQSLVGRNQGIALHSHLFPPCLRADTHMQASKGKRNAGNLDKIKTIMPVVIPAEAGIYFTESVLSIDSRFRGNDIRL